jgi:hypothetical protein
MTTPYKIPVEENFEFQSAVKDKDLTAPPGGEAKGDRYLIVGTGTGAWSGQIGNIAIYNGSGWNFITKKEGFIIWVQDENLFYLYNGSAWAVFDHTKIHTQNTDTHLGTVDADIAMGTHKLTGLSVPATAGDSIRQTAIITEASGEDAINKRHSHTSPSVNALGTAYTLTATEAKIDFGTTDPNVTLTSGGNYLLKALARVDLVGATFAANRIVTLKLRKQLDSYTKLLLEGQEADGSTLIFDEIGKAVTAVGTAQIDTAQYKFGISSILLDGDSDYVTLADSDDWEFGTGDFTIDLWVRVNILGTGYIPILDHYQDTDNVITCNLYSAADGTNQNLYFQAISGGVTKAFYYNAAAQTNMVPNATWTHIAFVRNGTTFKIFVNGESKTLTAITAIGTNDLGTNTGLLRIGTTQFSGGLYFNGWLSGVRISKGIARWTANFTPQTTMYSIIDNTTRQFKTDITTTKTYTAAIISLEALYTGTASEVIELAGYIDTVPSAGSIQVVEANIIALLLS